MWLKGDVEVPILGNERRSAFRLQNDLTDEAVTAFFNQMEMPGRHGEQAYSPGQIPIFWPDLYDGTQYVRLLTGLTETYQFEQVMDETGRAVMVALPRGGSCLWEESAQGTFYPARGKIRVFSADCFCHVWFRSAQGSVFAFCREEHGEWTLVLVSCSMETHKRIDLCFDTVAPLDAICNSEFRHTVLKDEDA